MNVQKPEPRPFTFASERKQEKPGVTIDATITMEVLERAIDIHANAIGCLSDDFAALAFEIDGSDPDTLPGSVAKVAILYSKLRFHTNKYVAACREYRARTGEPRY